MDAPTLSSCKTKGFTLLELLVVLVIIGLLAGIVGPNLFKHVGQSEITTAKAQMDMLGKALDAYRLDVGRYPETGQGLAALTQRPSGEQRWNGPYLKKDVPQDPWGNAYVYREPGTDDRDYELISLGKDGTTGGADENADLVSW